MPQISDNLSPRIEAQEGDIIIEQKQIQKGLVFLQQGKVDLKLYSDSTKTSYRLFSFQGPCFISPTASILNIETSYSVISSGISVLSVYSNTKETLLKIISTQANMGTILIRSLIKEIVELHNKINTMMAVDINIEKYLSSIHLAYLSIDESMLKLFQATDSLPNESVIVKKAYNTYRQNLAHSVSIPVTITEPFFQEDHIDSETMIHSLVHIDQDELNYFKHFSLLPPQILNAIALKDPEFILLTIERLAKIHVTLLESFDHLVSAADENLNHIAFAPQNWLEQSVNQIVAFETGKLRIEVDNFLLYIKFFWKILVFLEKQYTTVFSYSLAQKIDPKLMGKIKSFINNPVQKGNSGVSSNAEPTVELDTKILDQFKNTAEQVMEYAEISTEKRDEYRKIVKQFKSFKNLLDTEGDIRKVRKQVNTFFWSFYEAAMLKHLKKKDKLTKVIEIFLNYSVLEEDLLEPVHLVLLYQATEKDSDPTCKYPIYTAIEWITEIYEGRKPTSINDLGMTFFELLKQDNKDAGWKRESDLPPEVFNPESKAKYEINNMIAVGSKLTSGAIVNNIAMLTSFQIIQSLDRSIVTKKVLSDKFDLLLSKDYTCFHREVLFEDAALGIVHEFVQVQVCPTVILVPMAGPNFQFWQEKDSKDKAAPGRLLCPNLAMGDLLTMLLGVTACYRWELTKALLGPDWNNISQASITADYTDYVQFFKRNKELSPEVKEKLGSEFKRFRDDRSRFVHDYIIWILFESEGTQRMNRVARKIFAKHIPFPKAIREKLLKLPSYTDLINKSVNVKRRKALELEPRIKKYRQAGMVPEIIEQTYKYYLMDI